MSGLMNLLSEINCRIEHGSNDNGHLNYVRYEIEKILYGKDVKKRDLEKEINRRREFCCTVRKNRTVEIEYKELLNKTEE